MVKQKVKNLKQKAKVEEDNYMIGKFLKNIKK